MGLLRCSVLYYNGIKVTRSLKVKWWDKCHAGKALFFKPHLRQDLIGILWLLDLCLRVVHDTPLGRTLV